MCNWDFIHNRYLLSEDLVWYVIQSEGKAEISLGVDMFRTFCLYVHSFVQLRAAGLGCV